MTHATTFLAAAAFLTLPVSAVAVDTDAPSIPKYQVVDLGTLGGDSTFGTSMNASGQVTGSSEAIDCYWGECWTFERAFIWDGTTIRELPLADGYFGGYSDGRAINDNGQVTGMVQDFGGRGGRAALWSGDDIKLHPDGFFWFSFGSSINAAGEVLGLQGEPPGDGFQAFVWDGSVIRTVPTPSSVEYTYPSAINDIGQAVGFFYVGEEIGGFISDAAGTQYLSFRPADINAVGHVVGRTGGFVQGQNIAVLWDGSLTYDLGTLGGTYSSAHFINDIGQVAGLSTIPGDAATHAFLWSNGVMHDLGSVGSGDSLGVGTVTALNNVGQVVGYAGGYFGGWAFVSDGTHLRDLNQLISDKLPDRPTLQRGEDLNNFGQILVNGTTPAGEPRAYVLTPISLLIDWLRGEIQGIGLGKKLTSNLETASRHYEAGRLTQTCSQFNRLASGLNDYGAPELVEDVTDIRVAVGCP